MVRDRRYRYSLHGRKNRLFPFTRNCVTACALDISICMATWALFAFTFLHNFNRLSVLFLQMEFTTINLISETITKNIIFLYVISCVFAVSGSTEIFSFGDNVKFRRAGIYLQDSDNDGDHTNFTAALKVIREEVSNTSCSNIRVFLITDGCHNTDEDPTSEINMMSVPVGKLVEVYLLGIGEKFPKEYSEQIRSKLHTGALCCPALFHCKANDAEPETIGIQFIKIRRQVNKMLDKLLLKIPGKLLPFIDDNMYETRRGEFIYFDAQPEEILKNLRVSCDGIEIPINKYIIDASARFLVFHLYKHWNSVILHKYIMRQFFSDNNFAFMKEMFQFKVSALKATVDDKTHISLKRKNLRALEIEFNTLINQSLNIIKVESKYFKEMTDKTIKSGVLSRFDTKLMIIRGYSNKQWKNDVAVFKELYLSLETDIKKTESPKPEECCPIEKSSFLSDLQKRNFLELLNEQKSSFLTKMNFTGVPFWAPIRDSSQINPWTLEIRYILSAEYSIISQRILEFSNTSCNDLYSDSASKEVKLKSGQVTSVCNAVVPIIPKHVCELLKPLVRTNMFSACATYCILKNTTIVDDGCHLAALGCCWMKTISDHPLDERPIYIMERLENFECTAKLYLDKPSIAKYIDTLLTKPRLCMISKTNLQDDKVNLRCESILKVAFLLHMCRYKFLPYNNSKPYVYDVMQMVLIEFLGRCLSDYNSKTPYMDFALNISNKTKEMFKQELIQVRKYWY